MYLSQTLVLIKVKPENVLFRISECLSNTGACKSQKTRTGLVLKTNGAHKDKTIIIVLINAHQYNHDWAYSV